MNLRSKNLEPLQGVDHVLSPRDNIFLDLPSFAGLANVWRDNNNDDPCNLKRAVATSLSFFLALAAPVGRAADVPIDTAAKLLSGNEATVLIQADFIRFDPRYLEQ